MTVTFEKATKKSRAAAIPVYFCNADTWRQVAGVAGAERFAAASGFAGKPGAHCLLPGADGDLSGVLFGIEMVGARARDTFLPGKLATVLPAGLYRFANAPHDLEQAALAFLLGLYRFTRYRTQSGDAPRLLAPEGIDAAALEAQARAVFLARDLVNTPANDLGPQELAEAVQALGVRHKAKVSVTLGDDLLAKNFPLIHAVGRASSRAPRLIDLTWGPKNGQRVTLVGKGVCYDTGGLDIKPPSAMALMKKDMGGAAAAIAAASMIMDAGLPIRLRLLVPAVENSISGNAFRTGDVYPSRKGVTVEIGNTDAEGRLVLADALALADEESPDILIDFATLTGAARVALGPDLPPFYSDDEALAVDIARIGLALHDPVWRLPLWPAYEAMLDAKTGTLNSAPGGGFAGSITAALFLRRFVEKAKSWAHFDIYAWTPSARPGRPEGGEAQAARLVYHLVAERFGAH